MGLSDKEVIVQRRKYGTNRITQIKRESFFKKYISSLGDPIIRILIIALGLKLVFLIKNFDMYETIGIVISIFIASFISTLSEYGSEKAFEKLQEENSKIKCKVKRNNKIEEISINDIVMNDHVVLGTGDKICADGIIIDGNINVDESTINGETIEKEKGKNDIVYRGTIIYNGNANMKVTAIGDNTFYGKIAKELQTKAVPSPLKIRLFKLAKIISRIGYVSAFLVAFSYLFSVIVIKNNFDLNLITNLLMNWKLMFGHILYSLTLCVTTIVVCVPEGLPMMITLVLSSNMKKMLKSKVLVRKLVGIETSGNINILFTDKTGTLTNGNLKVIGVVDGSGKKYIDKNELKKNKSYYNLVELSLTCNNEGTYNKEAIGGNSTDRALLNYIKSTAKYRIISKKMFDSTSKYSSCIIKYNDNNIKLYKGSPEIILSKCKYYYDEYGNKKILSSNYKSNIDVYTKKGIRVLACSIDDAFLCLILIKDEIKKESIEGVKKISKAHIQTVMVTGDNINTAISIGKEIGLYNKDNIAITSKQLNEISDIELEKLLPNLRIVARALPSDKSRLIKVCQNIGLVVGMTGDGVNDAPALKLSDVGFSMGSGTEVAKEASDIIIMDDNLLSISQAVLFGRTIFKSIRKFIIFQLTVNLCAVSLSVIGPFIGFSTPVTVIQMLWINMVMDTLAGLAFSYEAPLEEYMDEYPKNKKEHILNKYMLGEIFFTGVFSSLLCIFFLKSSYINSLFRNQNYFMTGFFGLFIFISIFNCFNARTSRINLLSHLKDNIIFILIIIFVAIVQILMIYYGGSLFRTVGLNIKELLIMIIMSFSVIPIDWFRKIYLRINGEKGGV